MIKCPNDDPAEFDRYRQLVRGAMGAKFNFVPETETAAVVQVERGLVFPLVLSGLSPPTNNAIGSIELLPASVIDRGGHRRPAYPGLLVYSLAQASWLMSGQVERKTTILNKWLDRMEDQISRFDWSDDYVPASRGSEGTGAAWAALALWASASTLPESRDAKRYSEWFQRLASSQQKSGAFLHATSSDNPETLWYHELVLLHAAASYAAQANDAEVTAAVMRAAEYHLNETQPDHATSQPWGLLAFIWNPLARPLADQLLHSIQVQHPGTSDGVTSMLLADCLYCIEMVSC